MTAGIGDITMILGTMTVIIGDIVELMAIIVQDIGEATTVVITDIGVITDHPTMEEIEMMLDIARD